jgi:hypothetical protein
VVQLPPQSQPVPVSAQVEMVCQRETPLVVPPPLPQLLTARLLARGPAPSSSQPMVQPHIDDDLDGWTGTQVHYLRPKKKKNKKKLAKSAVQKSEDKVDAYLTDEGQGLAELDALMVVNMAQYMLLPPQEDRMGTSDVMPKDGDVDMADDM